MSHQASALVTAAEISRLAGVTRATVSNWRRRHKDFPAPTGGTEASPLYDLKAVRAWLEGRGQASAPRPSEELRTSLRLHSGAGSVATRLLPLVLAAARMDKEHLAGLTGPADTAHADPTDPTDPTGPADADLAARATRSVNALAGSVPGTGRLRYGAGQAGLLRALLLCVRDEGAQTALDVLAERELEDSASSGTYRTPARLADLMAGLLAPAEGPYPRRVLDPACGSGALLASAAKLGAACLYGQDSLPVQAQRSTVRLLLLASPGAEVEVHTGDSLRADAFPDRTADAVLCNPPYGGRDWGHDELAYDPRWAYGVPPRAEPELAWVQHALAHLTPGGMAVLLLPPAVASRTPGRRVRAELLRAGALRAVVALRPGVAVPLHIGLHLWVLQRPDPRDPAPDSVLFVDTVGEPAAGTGGQAGRQHSERREPVDWDGLSATVLGAWRAFAGDPAGFTGEPGTAQAVPVIDLLGDTADVTPTRYVRGAGPAEAPAATARQADEMRTRLAESVGSLDTATRALTGLRAAGREPLAWRTATIADLARGGAVTLHTATPAGRDAEDGGLPDEYAGRAVLTGRDVATGARASGDPGGLRLSSYTVVEAGDVLLPRIRSRGALARVADREDAGCLLGVHVHLFRPDPRRLDPWFLAGFLSAEENVSGASVGSTSVLQIVPRRLRVPLLPLAEQRRYGAAFAHLYELRTAARRAGELADGTAALLSSGLTGGALLPPKPPPPASGEDGGGGPRTRA